MKQFWENKKVVILGGSALIGSHLADYLVQNNVKSLRIVDDLSSGKLENIHHLIDTGVEFQKRDLREWSGCSSALYQTDLVFHLACAHGGRAFVDTHEVDCYDNLSLDAKIFRVCAERGVEKVLFSSSACVYPTNLQQDNTIDLKLTEDLETWDNPAKPDGAYGWAKLSAEKTLNAYVKAKHFKGVSTRSFTVYGERLKENHAIGAMIMKTLLKQEPFEVFGDGKQKRNWTYVKDIVRGMALAMEKLDDGVVNLGTEEINTPNSALEIIWNIMGWRPANVNYLLDKPVGVVNRIADGTKAREVLGWQPECTFEQGLQNTINWYLNSKNKDELIRNFEKLIYER